MNHPYNPYGQRAVAPGQIPPGAQRHMEALPLDADGTLQEVIVLKRYGNGDRIFIRVQDLDDEDQKRMRSFLSEQHAAMFELWDLLANRRLGNGMNALEYFHQLAKHFVAQSRTIRVPSATVVTGGWGGGPAGQTLL